MLPAMLWQWLPLVLCSTAVLCLPFPSSMEEETDNEASRKVLGSSVVTSVSVIMDLGNGTKKYFADAAGKPVPRPTSASMLGSPPDLLHPDRYEFYTFNEAGDLVKRLMTLEEIQGIIASGDGDSGEVPPNYYHQELPPGLKSPTLLGEGEIGELSSPVDGVHEVVESVQNVLKEEMAAVAKNKTTSSTTPKPTTIHFHTWIPDKLNNTSTSIRTSTASVPTTYRPPSRKPVKKPTTYIPSSRRPSRPTTTPITTSSSTTELPSPTTTPPQKIFSRRPIPPASRIPSRRPSPATTEKLPTSTLASTTRYSTTTTSSTTTTTERNVPEKTETTSKLPIASDIDGNLLDNEVSFASASNVNTEIINNTISNATEVSTTVMPTKKVSDTDEPISKLSTSSWATMADKTTEVSIENNQNSESPNDNMFSADSSVTSIQNIKPSVTVISNSAVNTISGQASTWIPGFQNEPNKNNANDGGESKPGTNSSTSIQNVEPMVTVIINSTVNAASGPTTMRDPISGMPFFGNTGTFMPGPPNLQSSPTSTVTERIAADSSSHEYTTSDSSSEEESSENSNSVESVSTEFPDNVLSTLLQMLKADVTTQSSEEYVSSETESETFEVAKTNASVVSSNTDVNKDMQNLGNTSDIDNTVASPSQISSANTTNFAESIQQKPLMNDSISSIMEMLMDEKPTSESTESLILEPSPLTFNKNISVTLQDETKLYINNSTLTGSSTSIVSNKTSDILTPASSESGNIVLYSNNLLAQTEQPEMEFTPPSLSSIAEEKIDTKTKSTTTTPNITSTKTSNADAVENPTTVPGVHNFITTILTDTDSETDMMNEKSTETLKITSQTNKNTEVSSVTDINTKIITADDSNKENKISAPSDIDEVLEKGTISPDSYIVISGGGGAIQEGDLVAPPKQQILDDSSAVSPEATVKEPVVIKPNKDEINKTTLVTVMSTMNQSELQHTDLSVNTTATSSNKKHAIAKLNATEQYTTVVSLINSEVTTEMIENSDDDDEKIHTTTIMSTITTKTPVVTTPDLTENLAAANSGFVSLKISPELEESVSNVLSQVSNKTATTILDTDKDTMPDITTQVTTTNSDDTVTVPILSSTMIDKVDQSNSLLQTIKENISEISDNAGIRNTLQHTNISQATLHIADTNKISYTVTSNARETTTDLYSAETTMSSIDVKVQTENENLAPKLKYTNKTNINDIKEDTKEIEIETRVDVKTRGNVSDEHVNLMSEHKNDSQMTQTGSTVMKETQNDTHTAAGSSINKLTDLSGRQNESKNALSEEMESITTVMSQETATPRLVEPAEETSTILFAEETATNVVAATAQISKNKTRDDISVSEMGERMTTLIPMLASTDVVTDRLLLASQLKGTQVKLIDNEEEQMLKVDTVTVRSKEGSSADMSSQAPSEEMSTSTWQKIFDSSEKQASKSTTSKSVETGPDGEPMKDTNYIDITSSANVKNAMNATDVKASEGSQKIENVLDGGNSIITEEKPTKTSGFSTNKNTSKIVSVSGITQAIFHTELYDHVETTEEPIITTTNTAKIVAETILPSKYVEYIANAEATSAEATNTEDVSTEIARIETPSNETATETEVDNEVNSTEKTWSLVSTMIPPQTKITTSRTADQTTKAHADIRVTTLVDTRRPAQSPTVDLHPAPEENLGLESTTFNLDKDVSDFTELCNELALRLWKPVANKRATVSRSLVMSPFAVTSLLAMVFLGARGGTSGQMNDILRLDDMVTFNPHQVFRNVTESLVMTKNPGIATAAFVRELYSDKMKGKLLDFYKERAQQFYDGHVEEVNFNMVGDVVRRRTNLLVKRQTGGRVPEYIRGSNIMLRPPLSVFSANIFQTDCSGASTSSRDGEMYFTVIPASRQRRLVPVPAVVWRSGFLAGYDPMLDATAVAIGTADSLVSTVLILPGQQGNTAPGDSVAALEDRLWNSPSSQGAWSRLLRSLLPRPGLELQLPRFSHRSMLNMTGVLQRMGLKDLFSEGRADLKGLNGLANDLHLSDIVQVNTFGTCGELAADARHHVEIFPGTSQRVGRRDRHDDDLLSDLTGIPLALRPRQARLPETPRLRLDRPFLYAVRHNPTGLILHMGRFNPRLVR